MYADHLQIYLSFPYENWEAVREQVKLDLGYVNSFAQNHGLQVNVNKSSLLLFGKKEQVSILKENFRLELDGACIPVADEAKNLGLILDNNFRYKKQISGYISSAYMKLRSLYPHRQDLSIPVKKRLCEALVLSQFSYCATIYHPCLDNADKVRIQRVQNSCLRYIFGIRKFDHISHKLRDVQWLNMYNRRELLSLCLFHKIIQHKSPRYLYQLISFRSDVHNINTRYRGRLSPPSHRLTLFTTSFQYQICNLYNGVEDAAKSLSLKTFRYFVRNKLFKLQCNSTYSLGYLEALLIFSCEFIARFVPYLLYKMVFIYFVLAR